MSFTIKLIMVMKVQINSKLTKELQEPIISSVLLFPSYLFSTKLSLISGLRTDHKSMLSESFNNVPPYHGECQTVLLFAISIFINSTWQNY